VDFHALRHTFITNLCNAGVHPKTAQALGRHSSIVLTRDHYTHLTLANQTGALDALPDWGALSSSETVRATGTDNLTVPKNVPELGREGAISGKELQGSKDVLQSDTTRGKALQALAKARVSSIMRDRCEGGGIGIRAGLRIQSRKG
jgi:hypothetical protein